MDDYGSKDDPCPQSAAPHPPDACQTPASCQKSSLSRSRDVVKLEKFDGTSPYPSDSFLSSSYSESKDSVVYPGNEVLVSFRERKVLRELFILENLRERKDYRAAMKAEFEAEVPPIDFANLPPPPIDEHGNPDPLHVSNAEMMAEAFELFIGQRMQDFDAMFAERYVLFESAMVVVQAGGLPDEDLLLSRTVGMWARLRYVYFNLEDLPIANLRKQVSAVIQTEILELSEQQRSNDLRAKVSG